MGIHVENQNLFKAQYGAVSAAMGKLVGLLPETFAARVLGGDDDVIEKMAAVAGVPTLPRTKCEVFVPDCAPAELVARAKEDLDLTHLDGDLAKWDFYRYRVAQGQPARVVEVRGERYEVLTWAPGEHKMTKQVRAHFSALSADGNTGAFISWIRMTNPMGYHVSIPSDDALLSRGPESRGLYAPCFYRGAAGRELHLHDVDGEWGVSWVFVAFRKLPR